MANEDKRDSRQQAGQAHIDHISARYNAAKEAKKQGKSYDLQDVDRAVPYLSEKELKTDFPNYAPPVKKRAGGAIKSPASKRADGCAARGKTRGRMV